MHISFEFFPPKQSEQLSKLQNITKELEIFSPEFFSVTYGAGGSTQEKTLQTVLQLKNYNIDVAPHLTCISSSPQQIKELLKLYIKHDIKRLVVLRGDLPSGILNSINDFNYAYQLIEFIRQETGDHFFIEVAAYPEMHPETQDPKLHIKHLKQKFDAGANRAITQYFFNIDAYEQLLNDCQKAKITQPIIPGIMPITKYTQLAHFSKRCGAEIPRWLALQLQHLEATPEKLKEFGADFMANFCKKLITLGGPGLHFYTLNQLKPTMSILKQLSLS